MKFFTFLVLISLTTLNAFAQESEIDSIENILKTYKKEDTTSVDLFNNLSYAYVSTDPEKGLLYATKAIILAKKLKSSKQLGRAFGNRALNYTYLGKDSLAIYWYQEGINYAISTRNRSGEGVLLNNLAILYINKSEYRKSLDLRLKALVIFTELNDQKKIGNILSNIGVTYFYIADYPKALSYYFKALKIAEDTKNKHGETSATMNIGMVYKKLQQYNKALLYYEKSLKLNRISGDQINTSNALANIATIFDEQGLHQKALDFYNQALTISRKIKYRRGEASHLTDIGIVYHNLKNYGLAINYFHDALKIFETSPDLNAMAVVYNQLANIIINAPDTILINAKIPKPNRYLEAEKFAQLALKVSQESELLEREMTARETLSLIYEKQNNFKLALAAYKNYTLLKDSIYTDDKKSEIAQKEIQYEADKKHAVASEEIKNQKTLRNYSIAGSIILLLVAISIFIFYKKHRDAIQKQNELLYKAKVADTDMRILRLQMNPHFIFNSLNSISDYISKNDIKNADYYLSKFAKLMRGILENSEEKEIPLADELKMLELYMQLEGSRLNNKFTYEIKISDDVNPEITMIPPLILQPFVENSIWHGLADKNSDGKITIEVTRDNTLLNCIVEDNGVGRKATKPNSGKSYGMKITKDRIELLNKLKSTNASINLVDLEKGTRIEVKLPFETEE